MIDVDRLVSFEVELGDLRERHACSLSHWLRWVREGAICLRAAQGELFPARTRRRV